ncbi:MAG TPA: glycosyltransferase family 2 protein, partial [Candidatus Hydrogenedentes bacterium]|nr:glycosyltransferase family 2 protein [Candidatus Hydrogenedentota bacterium]
MQLLGGAASAALPWLPAEDDMTEWVRITRDEKLQGQHWRRDTIVAVDPDMADQLAAAGAAIRVAAPAMDTPPGKKQFTLSPQFDLQNAPLYVVIASRGRPKELTSQIGHVLPQLQAADQLIVVVDSCAQTRKALEERKDKKLRVLNLEGDTGKGPNLARRVGNSLVPVDAVIVEVDDHDMIEPHALAEVRKAFHDPKVMVAYCDAMLTDGQN